MTSNHKKWHIQLVKYWMEKYKYSEEYCDVIAIIKRNFYPTRIDLVPFN